MTDVLTFDASSRPCDDGEEESLVFWNELEDEEDQIAQDGYDRPKLRLSAAAVWARCPLLRPVIQEHSSTQSAVPSATAIAPALGMSTMCLAVDASYEALYCITRYVRSGVLLCPTVSSKQDLAVCLDLIKLSHRWGMHSLLKEVVFTFQ
jgi:hypothetical protein